MNLILSDVEETITIVDVDVEGGGESVRVRSQSPSHHPVAFEPCTELTFVCCRVCADGQAQRGDAVRSRGWSHLGELSRLLPWHLAPVPHASSKGLVRSPSTLPVEGHERLSNQPVYQSIVPTRQARSAGLQRRINELNPTFLS